MVALRSPAAQVGCCSYSSGRAVQSTSSGTPCDQSARCSRNESRASSAQCRSSNTSTVGPCAASPSRKRRQAVNDSSCEAGSAGAPTSGASRALSQARSGSSAGSGTLELGCGLLGRVRLEDAALRLDDLPQRPEGDPLPVGQAAALPPADELGALLDVAEQLRAEPALAHPRLAHDRHQLAGALLRGALERPDQKRLLELPADERRRVRAGHVRAEAGARPKRTEERERLRLALHRTGSSGS